MKGLLLVPFFACAMLTIHAQTKKPAAKPAPKTTTKPATATASAGGINQNNYGQVVQYLNKIIDCLNNQGPELEQREPNMEEMENFLNKKKDYCYVSMFYIDLNDSKAFDYCPDATPPAIMGATDVAFFKENYQALRDAFLKLAMAWNDIAAHKEKISGTINLSRGETKLKYDELVALENNYYAIRKTLATRNKQLQRQLFPFSVAKSPNKLYYTNMYNDLNAVKDFASLMSPDYEEMMKNKEMLLQEINKVESAVIPHITQVPPKPKNDDRDFAGSYSFYYDAITTYIKRAKVLLNGEKGNFGRFDVESAYHDYNYAIDDVIRNYNSTIQR